MLGHVSARASDPDTYWVKPGPIGLAEVSRETLVRVDLDGHRLEGDGPLHGELPIHAEIYRRRPDVGCVVHTHPLVVAAFSASDASFKLVGQDSVPFLDGVPAYDSPLLVVTPDRGRAVADSLGEKAAVIMRNHGLTVAAASIERAVVLAVMLERSLRIQVAAAALGTVLPMSADEARTMADEFESYAPGRIMATWAYLGRRAGGS